MKQAKQMKTFSKKKWIVFGISTVLFGFSHCVFASGFQLFEENGTSTGDFGAGGAASANDASTAFYNPAGLVRMTGQQLVLSADTISSNLEYKGNTTLSTPAVSPFPATQSGSAQGGSASVVPAFNYAAPINSSVVFGLSATVPFGLESDYSENSFLAYAATKTSVEVIDLSPVLGLQLTKALSFGFGPDFDYVDAELDSVGGIAGMPALNTTSKNTASGWGLGWHTGLLYQFTQATRMGLAYHSKVTADVDGTSKFTGPLAFGGGGQFSTDALSSSVALPPTTMLSLFHRINNAWALMGTVAYTQWGVFNNLDLNNVQSVSAFGTPVYTNVNLPQNFRNTWRFAVGASYQPFKKWEFTAGTGYDETPTVDQYRNVRLPDGNRFALAAGVHYQATKALGLDVGYTHLFIQKVPINITQQYGGESVTTNGHEESSADIVGLQLTWNIT